MPLRTVLSRKGALRAWRRRLRRCNLGEHLPKFDILQVAVLDNDAARVERQNMRAARRFQRIADLLGLAMENNERNSPFLGLIFRSDPGFTHFTAFLIR